ncbi:DUF302 domain-containing protein [Sulfuriferula nivalis]|uniref:DUF302 domain-containing protein n=1 Tax=Sulfuriferula nivalis TaxID=2675298 RepID=A0A809SGJ6_9PROT|nr:DUF302 domain-containing protein [Sulfuriferula nivalis]BBO99989.1 hypothetical protein SFSGTM_06980 [Sulfuriferula nivalis]
MKNLILALFLSYSAASMAADTNEFSHIYQTQGDFETVRDSIVSSVEGRGLKINHINHISEMLARTGKDLGASKEVYLNAEQIEFCSATLSRSMMEADPTNIMVCPYSIAVYNLPAQPNMIYVSYRKPPVVKARSSREIFKQVEQLLNDIITEGIDLSK